MTQMEQDAYIDVVLKTLGRRIEELEDDVETMKLNYRNEMRARTDEGDALRARIDEYKRINSMLNEEARKFKDRIVEKEKTIDELKKVLKLDVIVTDDEADE